jgi:hypothetical protein
MQSFLGSKIETPSEYDEPATVADNLMLALPQLGFKLSFSSSKIAPGQGLAVVTILDALLRQSLMRRRFARNSFRAVSGFGGEQAIETVGGGADDEGVVDDAVDVDEPDDSDTVGGFESGSASTVVDSLELKKEAERVAPRLQIRIPAAKNDWRAHFSMMTQHHHKISELTAQLAPTSPAPSSPFRRARRASTRGSSPSSPTTQCAQQTSNRSKSSTRRGPKQSANYRRS